MRVHAYLLRTTLKNKIKELIHKPAKLILYLLIVALIVMGILSTMFASNVNTASQPTYYILPIFAIFLMIFFVLAIHKGLSSGDSLFEMSDVNFLFVAPVNPRATLLYGIIKLASISFWSGFFLLFQSNTLAIFGIKFSGVLILFAFFMITMVVLTLLSLVIYSATNSNPKRKTFVKIVSIAIFIPIVTYFLVQFVTGGDLLVALNSTSQSWIFAATPFIGWASAGAFALIEGKLLVGFGWLLLLALSGIAMLAYIMFSRSDYYEDVLVATETAFEKKRAATEGDLQSANLSNRKIKVTKTGLAGYGARVFLFKHLRETFRQNRFGFISTSMICMTIAFTLAAYFSRDQKGTTITFLTVILFMQVFMVGTGRGMLETLSYYIYMIPASSFQKIFWSNMETIMKATTEGILFLAIPGMLFGGNLLIIIGSIAVYIVFTLMLIGINNLFMRVTGADMSKGLLMMLYFLAVALLMAPGLIISLVVASIVSFSVKGIFGTILGLFLLAGWELIVALVSMYASRGALHNCDMSTVQNN